VTISIIISLFLFILPAHASDGSFYQSGQEGWYQVIPEPEELEEFVSHFIAFVSIFHLASNNHII
jgi:conjugal transfer pilus assembly protein TraF